MAPDSIDRGIIRRVCGDLPDSADPFGDIAGELGVQRSELLKRLAAMKERGELRRFGAVLKHQTAGFSANGMSVWNVPDEQVDSVGELMASFREISHCYIRPRLPGRSYNLYGMIHGKTEDEVRVLAARIAEETGITDYDVLFSRREFKKTSMVYFSEGE